MHRLLIPLLMLLLGCPPALNNPGGGGGDDDDATGDDDDATGDDDDVTMDDDDVTMDDDDTIDPPLLPIGMECTDNNECASGVCWDFANYDPWCGGAVCSDRCETTEACIDLAFFAGAGSPDGARCGEDGLCDFVGASLGAFWCADGAN